MQRSVSRSEKAASTGKHDQTSKDSIRVLESLADQGVGATEYEISGVSYPVVEFLRRKSGRIDL